VKAAADFEQKMAEVSTLITGVAEKDLPLIRQGILELSTEVPQSAVILTDAFYQIQSATGLGAEAMQILAVAAKGAVAGVTDVNTYAKAMLAVMKPFKLGVEDSARAADFLQNVIKEGSVKAEDLASNLGKVAAVAAASGTDLNTLGAMLAVLTNETQQVDEQFTYLKGAMMAFQKPTKESAEAIEEFGLKTVDASGKVRPLIDILGDIAAKKLSLNEIMRIMPEKEAAQAILQMANNYDVLREKQESMGKSQGVMLEAYDKMIKTFINQSKLLWNSIKALGIVIGEGLLESMKDIVRMIKEKIDWLRKWEEKTHTIRDTIKELMGHLKGLAEVIAKSFDIASVREFLSYIAGVKAEFSLVENVMAGVQTGLKALNILLGAVVVTAAFFRDMFVQAKWAVESIYKALSLKMPDPFPEAAYLKALNAFADIHNLLDQIDKKVVTPKIDPKPAVAEIDKLGVAFDEAAQEGEKIPEVLEKAKEKAEELGKEAERALKLKITLIETEARVKIEEMKTQADILKEHMKIEVELETGTAKIALDKLKVQFESLKEVTEGISEGFGALVSGIQGAKSTMEKWEFGDKLTKMLAMQERLVDAQIALMEAQKRRLDDPKSRIREHIIRVVGSDLTWADGFVTWLLDRMKLRIEEEGFECLCGV